MLMKLQEAASHSSAPSNDSTSDSTSLDSHNSNRPETAANTETTA